MYVSIVSRNHSNIDATNPVSANSANSLIILFLGIIRLLISKITNNANIIVHNGVNIFKIHLKLSF